MKRMLKSSAMWLTHKLGIAQSAGTLSRDAQAYWSDEASDEFQYNSHWKAGMPAEAWDGVGADHFALYEQSARMLNHPRPVKSIVEWGCGGGCNAVRFARECDRFYGVDVVAASLDECEKQLKSAGPAEFSGVLITIDDPESAVTNIADPCDFFLCTYVFETLPTREMGLRILRVARQLLAPDGFAIIQIKYATDEWRTRSRTWGYRRNIANMTTYRIEEFWESCTQAGLHPKAVTLVPKQPLVRDERYGYFVVGRQS